MYYYPINLENFVDVEVGDHTGTLSHNRRNIYFIGDRALARALAYTMDGGVIYEPPFRSNAPTMWVYMTRNVRSDICAVNDAIDEMALDNIDRIYTAGRSFSSIRGTFGLVVEMFSGVIADLCCLVARCDEGEDEADFDYEDEDDFDDEDEDDCGGYGGNGGYYEDGYEDESEAPFITRSFDVPTDSATRRSDSADSNDGFPPINIVNFFKDESGEDGQDDYSYDSPFGPM